METYKTIADDFKKNGILVLKNKNENQLTELLREANNYYNNQEPFITDHQYDIIKEFMETTYPNNSAIYEIGAPVNKNKATLPYYMGSMDKIKPDTYALTNWTKKFTGQYVLSCKLDGVSGLYTTEGKEPKLYTRGDGKIGQDISHLISFLRLPKTKDIVIRGEFIIPKSIFNSKYKTTFANPRNMVAGICNHKIINESVTDLHFVAYEVIKPILKPTEQFLLLSTLDIETVLYKTMNSISNEFLSTTLIETRNNYIYETDGVIVADDKLYERKIGNPEHAFAFKMVLSNQIAEAKVVDVIWTASKDGYLKPRVQIEPIYLGGVNIDFATGFNGSFIEKNKIGIGTIIEIIRSGDVIPYIRKIIVPSDEPKMPSCPYIWNNTNIDIMVENIDMDETVREKNIAKFFHEIGVEGLGPGNVAHIIHAGYNTIPLILNMTFDNLLSVEGFKYKTATKLYNGIKEKVVSSSLLTIMASSNMFGRGFNEKKIEIIMEEYPSVLLSKETDKQKIDKITSIKGMSTKSAEAFVERIPHFIHFIQNTGLVNKLDFCKNNLPVNKEHYLFGKTIVITGFRDILLQEKLKKIGVKLGTSVSSNTFVVLVKDKAENTGKISNANKLNIPVITLCEFNAKYFD